MIKKSFKKCSISNNFDRTEDDILWTDVCNDSHDTDEEDEDDIYALIEEQAKKLLEDLFNKENFFRF